MFLDKCLHIFICLTFICRRKSYNNIIAIEYAITLQFDSKFSNEKWKKKNKSLIDIVERLLKKKKTFNVIQLAKKIFLKGLLKKENFMPYHDYEYL